QLAATSPILTEDQGCDLLDHWQDGRVKMLVTSRMLRARRADPALWVDGDYFPVSIDTAVDAATMAWARHRDDRWMLVAAAFRTARLTPDAWPIGAVWGPSRLLVPPAIQATHMRDIVSGAVHQIITTESERWIFLSDVFGVLPVATLSPCSKG